MKIEIEFTNSYEAKLTIDGRELSVECSDGCTTLKGIKSPETNTTLGGIVASTIYGKIAEFQQAVAAATEIDPDAETWTTLSDEAVSEAEDKIW